MIGEPLILFLHAHTKLLTSNRLMALLPWEE